MRDSLMQKWDYGDTTSARWHLSNPSSGTLRPLHPCLHPHCLLSLTHQLSRGGKGALAPWRHPAGWDPKKLEPGTHLPSALRLGEPPWWAGCRGGRRGAGDGRAQPCDAARRRSGRGGDDCGDVWQQLSAGDLSLSLSHSLSHSHMHTRWTLIAFFCNSWIFLDVLDVVICCTQFILFCIWTLKSVMKIYINL